jgi:hypothetical protein
MTEIAGVDTKSPWLDAVGTPVAVPQKLMRDAKLLSNLVEP